MTGGLGPSASRERAVLYPGTGEHLAPVVMARKSGFVVEDLDGNLLLDMASGSASVPLGACHPRLIDAAVSALRRYGNEDTHALTSEYVAPLAERLLQLAPPGCTRVDFALNGTEAIEIAVRLMRRATGRPLVLGFLGGYHGETATTAALGAEISELGRGVRAITAGYFHIPYPNPFRNPFAAPRPGGSGDATIDYLRDHVLFHAVDPADVAGVVIEPVLGSGGVVTPPESFFPALAELCAEHGWLLCADEVKTGCGRCGTFLAVERLGVTPDVICLGKGLGGGIAPIGAVLGSERALGGFDDVSTGSTWSWLPIGCAAALAFRFSRRLPKSSASQPMSPACSWPAWMKGSPHTTSITCAMAVAGAIDTCRWRRAMTITTANASGETTAISSPSALPPLGTPTITPMPRTANAIAPQVRGESGSRKVQNANSPVRIGVIAWISSTCAMLVWFNATMKLADATAMPAATATPARLATDLNAARRPTLSPATTNASTAASAKSARPTI